HQDRSGAWRNDAVDAVTVQLELPGRTQEEDERVVRQGRLERLIGGLLTVAQRLQAHPPSPVAGRQRLAGEKVDEVKRPVQAAESRFSLSHHFSPRHESGRPDHALPYYGSGTPILQRTVPHIAPSNDAGSGRRCRSRLEDDRLPAARPDPSAPQTAPGQCGRDEMSGAAAETRSRVGRGADVPEPPD